MRPAAGCGGAGDGRQRWRIPIQADGWPTWTRDGRLLVDGASPDTIAPNRFLTSVDVRSGRPLWHSALPMLANRPAAPLSAGAVIQVVDPQRLCLDVGTGRSVDQPTGSEAKP